MKAIVLVGPQDLRVMDVPPPKLTEEDHILLEVRACGVCGSDIRYYHGENPWALHTLGYNAPNPPNIILGHEYSGVVREVKSDRYAHLLGKRVGVQPWKGCGTCPFCRSGRENLCVNTIHMGHGQGWPTMEFYPGAMAEYCIAWGDHVYELSDDTSFEAAAMSDILGVAIHTVGRAPVLPNSDVLCIGGGPAGILSAQIALLRGARGAFLLETSPLAREIIGRYDSCTALEPAPGALADAVERKGSGFSAIYDSVGDPDLFSSALPFLEESGAYVNMAVQDRPLSISPKDLGCERTITSASNALYGENAESIDLISRKAVDVERIITHYAGFNDFLATFDLLLKDPKEAFKVVLRP